MSESANALASAAVDLLRLGALLLLVCLGMILGFRD